VQQETVQTQVLIVGGGPVGLALAIELGQRGIRCILVERNDRVGYAPRAKTTNVRTCEHLRRWGIADQLRGASPLGIDYPSNVVFATRLGGHLLTRFDNAFDCAPGRNPYYSEHAQWIPQYLVEEVLRAHAQSFSCVSLCFNTEFLDFEQHERGVHARVRDLEIAAETSIACAFLVGADGARSAVRDAIGAKMQGMRGLSRNYNIVFRAPGLAGKHGHGPAVMYWQVNGDVPSLVGPMDRGDKWFFMPTSVPDGMKLADFEAPSLIRTATGIDLPYEILSSDEWVASRLIADRYRDGRVFLAGDACHLHPPFGGHGMNMGVSDAVDLGWKMAAFLQGWGGPVLLASYEGERRPVHEFVMDEAVTNHALLGNQLWRDGIESDDAAGVRIRQEVGARIRAAKIREFKSLGVVLGYRYDGSSVIVGDGTCAPASDPLNYQPCARPGCLAPHAWLDDGASLYDKFGLGFTLLADQASAAPELAQLRDMAETAGFPLKIIQPGGSTIADLYHARYTLVRPDQHVAWRGNAWPADVVALFKQVSGRCALRPSRVAARSVNAARAERAGEADRENVPLPASAEGPPAAP
jgi:2-polyprenyl-6-methoxyphenol hydroxylase-like FAD-dependent oxidoreductase